MGSPLVIVAGQSNCFNYPSGVLPAAYMTLPARAWKWAVRGGGTALRQRRVPWTDLRATQTDPDAGDTLAAGPDLVIAKVLIDAGHAPSVILYARGGTSLVVEWKATTSELYQGLVSDVGYALASSRAPGHTSSWFVWIQGENDTLALADAQAYKANFDTFWAALKSDLAASCPGLRAVVVKLSTAATYCTYLTDIRSQYDAIGVAHADVTIYDATPCAVGGDVVHYTQAGTITLGTGIANAMIAAGSL